MTGFECNHDKFNKRKLQQPRRDKKRNAISISPFARMVCGMLLIGVAMVAADAERPELMPSGGIVEEHPRHVFDLVEPTDAVVPEITMAAPEVPPKMGTRARQGKLRVTQDPSSSSSGDGPLEPQPSPTEVNGNDKEEAPATLIPDEGLTKMGTKEPETFEELIQMSPKALRSSSQKGYGKYISVKGAVVAAVSQLPPRDVETSKTGFTQLSAHRKTEHEILAKIAAFTKQPALSRKSMVLLGADEKWWCGEGCHKWKAKAERDAKWHWNDLGRKAVEKKDKIAAAAAELGQKVVEKARKVEADVKTAIKAAQLIAKVATSGSSQAVIGGLNCLKNKKASPKMCPTKECIKMVKKEDRFTKFGAENCPAIPLRHGMSVAFAGRKDAGRKCRLHGVDVHCDRRTIGRHETFKLEEQGGGWIALKASNGRYCADDHDRIRCNRERVGGWERFKIERHSHGIALRGGRDNRFCADEGWRIVCNRNTPQGWEIFTPTCVEGCHPERCVVAHVGSSPRKSKSFRFTPKGARASMNATAFAKTMDEYKCPDTVNKDNALGFWTYADSFKINKQGSKMLVTRTDSTDGWGLDLRFECCKGSSTAPLTTSPDGCTNHGILHAPNCVRKVDARVCNGGIDPDIMTALLKDPVAFVKKGGIEDLSKMFLTLINGAPGMLNVKSALKNMRRIMPKEMELDPKALLDVILKGLDEVPIPEFDCVKDAISGVMKSVSSDTEMNFFQQKERTQKEFHRRGLTQKLVVHSQPEPNYQYLHNVVFLKAFGMALSEMRPHHTKKDKTDHSAAMAALSHDMRFALEAMTTNVNQKKTVIQQFEGLKHKLPAKAFEQLKSLMHRKSGVVTIKRAHGVSGGHNVFLQDSGVKVPASVFMSEVMSARHLNRKLQPHHAIYADHQQFNMLYQPTCGPKSYDTTTAVASQCRKVTPVGSCKANKRCSWHADFDSQQELENAKGFYAAKVLDKSSNLIAASTSVGMQENFNGEDGLNALVDPVLDEFTAWLQGIMNEYVLPFMDKALFWSLDEIAKAVMKMAGLHSTFKTLMDYAMLAFDEFRKADVFTILLKAVETANNSHEKKVALQTLTAFINGEVSAQDLFPAVSLAIQSMMMKWVMDLLGKWLPIPIDMATDAMSTLALEIVAAIVDELCTIGVPVTSAAYGWIAPLVTELIKDAILFMRQASLNLFTWGSKVTMQFILDAIFKSMNWVVKPGLESVDSLMNWTRDMFEKSFGPIQKFWDSVPDPIKNLLQFAGKKMLKVVMQGLKDPLVGWMTVKRQVLVLTLAKQPEYPPPPPPPPPPFVKVVTKGHCFGKSYQNVDDKVKYLNAPTPKELTEKKKNGATSDDAGPLYKHTTHGVESEHPCFLITSHQLCEENMLTQGWHKEDSVLATVHEEFKKSAKYRPLGCYKLGYEAAKFSQGSSAVKDNGVFNGQTKETLGSSDGFTVWYNPVIPADQLKGKDISNDAKNFIKNHKSRKIGSGFCSKTKACLCACPITLEYDQGYQAVEKDKAERQAKMDAAGIDKTSATIVKETMSLLQELDPEAATNAAMDTSFVETFVPPTHPALKPKKHQYKAEWNVPHAFNQIVKPIQVEELLKIAAGTRQYAAADRDQKLAESHGHLMRAVEALEVQLNSANYSQHTNMKQLLSEVQAYKASAESLFVQYGAQEAKSHQAAVAAVTIFVEQNAKDGSKATKFNFLGWIKGLWDDIVAAVKAFKDTSDCVRGSMTNKNSILYIPGYNGLARGLGDMFHLGWQALTHIPQILVNIWKKAFRNAGDMLKHVTFNVETTLKRMMNDLDPAGNPKIPPLNVDTVLGEMIKSFDKASETEPAYKCIRNYVVDGAKLSKPHLQAIEDAILKHTSQEYIVKVGTMVFQECFLTAVDSIGNRLIGEEGMAGLRAIGVKVVAFMDKYMNIGKWLEQLNTASGPEVQQIKEELYKLLRGDVSLTSLVGGYLKGIQEVAVGALRRELDNYMPAIWDFISDFMTAIVWPAVSFGLDWVASLGSVCTEWIASISTNILQQVWDRVHSFGRTFVTVELPNMLASLTSDLLGNVFDSVMFMSSPVLEFGDWVLRKVQEVVDMIMKPVLDYVQGHQAVRVFIKWTKDTLYNLMEIIIPDFKKNQRLLRQLCRHIADPKHGEKNPCDHWLGSASNGLSFRQDGLRLEKEYFAPPILAQEPKKAEANLTNATAGEQWEVTPENQNDSTAFTGDKDHAMKADPPTVEVPDKRAADLLDNQKSLPKESSSQSPKMLSGGMVSPDVKVKAGLEGQGPVVGMDTLEAQKVNQHQKGCHSCQTFVQGYWEGGVDAADALCTGKNDHSHNPMCPLWSKTDASSPSFGDKIKQTMDESLAAGVCIFETCRLMDRCALSKCDKCQLDEGSKQACVKKKLCTEAAPIYLACKNEKAIKEYTNELVKPMEGNTYHFTFQTIYNVAMKALEQHTDKKGESYTQEKSTVNKAVFDIKDLTMQRMAEGDGGLNDEEDLLIKANEKYTAAQMLKLEINDASVTYLSNGEQKERKDVSETFQLPFFVKLKNGKVTKFMHSPEDDAEKAEFKLKIAQALALEHHMPDETEFPADTSVPLTTFIETADQDGVHADRTTLKKNGKKLILQSRRMFSTSAGLQPVNADSRQLVMLQTRVKTAIVNHEAKMVEEVHIKQTDHTNEMKEDGLTSPPIDASTGKEVTYKDGGMADSELDSDEEMRLHFHCVEGDTPHHGLKQCSKSETLVRRNAEDARQAHEEEKEHALQSSHALVQKVPKDMYRADHRDTPKVARDREERNARQLPTLSTDLARKHFERAILLLNTDERVWRENHGTSTNGHRMLNNILKGDTKGSLRAEIVKVMKNDHPRIHARNKNVRNRIIVLLGRAHHGAAQRTIHTLLTTPRCLDNQEKSDMMLNLIQIPHLIQDLRAHVDSVRQGGTEGYSEHDRPRLMEMANSVTSALAGKLEPGEPWREQHMARYQKAFTDESASDETRLQMVQCLGNFGDRRNLDTTRKALRHADPVMRAVGVRALRGISGADISAMIRNAFIQDDSEEVQAAAYDELMSHRFTTKEHWAHLISQLAERGRPFSKAFIDKLKSRLPAVGEYQHLDGVQHVLEKVNGKSPYAAMEATAHDATSMLVGTSPHLRGVGGGGGDGGAGNSTVKMHDLEAQTSLMQWFQEKTAADSGLKSNTVQCTTCIKCLQKVGLANNGKIIIEEYEEAGHGNRNVGTFLQTCSCAGQIDRVPMPGYKQLFEPKYSATRKSAGNKFAGGGVYADAVAEACQDASDGTAGTWAAEFSAKAGIYVTILDNHIDMLAMSARIAKSGRSGMGGAAITMTVAGKEIRLPFGLTTAGALPVDGCTEVHPITIIPPAMSLDLPGFTPWKDVKESWELRKKFKKGGMKTSGWTFGKGKKISQHGDLSTSAEDLGESAMSKIGYEMVMIFRVAYVVKFELSFSLLFSLGIFVEPCTAQLGALTYGADPVIAVEVNVAGGIDIFVAEAVVGVDFTLFELHLPFYWIIWFDKPAQASHFCPVVHKSFEFQLIWFLLQGSFYIKVRFIVWWETLYQYFWPTTNPSSGWHAREADQGWLLEGSLPLVFSGACNLQVGAQTEKSEVDCRLRAPVFATRNSIFSPNKSTKSGNRGTKKRAYGYYVQKVPFSWEQASGLDNYYDNTHISICGKTGDDAGSGATKGKIEFCDCTGTVVYGRGQGDFGTVMASKKYTVRQNVINGMKCDPNLFDDKDGKLTGWSMNKYMNNEYKDGMISPKCYCLANGCTAPVSITPYFGIGSMKNYKVGTYDISKESGGDIVVPAGCKAIVYGADVNGWKKSLGAATYTKDKLAQMKVDRKAIKNMVVLNEFGFLSNGGPQAGKTVQGTCWPTNCGDETDGRGLTVYSDDSMVCNGHGTCQRFTGNMGSQIAEPDWKKHLSRASPGNTDGLYRGHNVGCTCFGGWKDNKCTTPPDWGKLQITTLTGKMGDTDGWLNDPDPRCEFKVRTSPYKRGFINPDIVSGSDRRPGAVVSLRSGWGYYCSDQGTATFCLHKNMPDEADGFHFRIQRWPGSRGSGNHQDTVTIIGGKSNKFCGVPSYGSEEFRCDFDQAVDARTLFRVTDSGLGDGTVKIQSYKNNKCLRDKSVGVKATEPCSAGNRIVHRYASWLASCKNCGASDSSIVNNVLQDTDHVDEAARSVEEELNAERSDRKFQQTMYTREFEGFDPDRTNQFWNQKTTSAFDTKKVTVEIICKDIDNLSADDFLGSQVITLLRQEDRVYNQDGDDIGRFDDFKFGVQHHTNRGQTGKMLYLRAGHDEYFDMKAKMAFRPAERVGVDTIALQPGPL